MKSGYSLLHTKIVIFTLTLLCFAISSNAQNDDGYQFHTSYLKDGNSVIQDESTVKLVAERNLKGTAYKIMQDNTILLSLQYDKRKSSVNIAKNIPLGGDEFKPLFNYLYAINLSSVNSGAAWSENSNVYFENGQEINLTTHLSVGDTKVINGTKFFLIKARTNGSFSYYGDAKIASCNVDYSEKFEILVSNSGDISSLSRTQKISTAATGAKQPQYRTWTQSANSQSSSGQTHTYENKFELVKRGEEIKFTYKPKLGEKSQFTINSTTTIEETDKNTIEIISSADLVQTLSKLNFDGSMKIDVQVNNQEVTASSRSNKETQNPPSKTTSVSVDKSGNITDLTGIDDAQLAQNIRSLFSNIEKKDKVFIGDSWNQSTPVSSELGEIILNMNYKIIKEKVINGNKCLIIESSGKGVKDFTSGEISKVQVETIGLVTYAYQIGLLVQAETEVEAKLETWGDAEASLLSSTTISVKDKRFPYLQGGLSPFKSDKGNLNFFNNIPDKSPLVALLLLMLITAFFAKKRMIRLNPRSISVVLLVFALILVWGPLSTSNNAYALSLGEIARQAFGGLTLVAAGLGVAGVAAASLPVAALVVGGALAFWGGYKIGTALSGFTKNLTNTIDQESRNIAGGATRAPVNDDYDEFLRKKQRKSSGNTARNVLIGGGLLAGAGVGGYFIYDAVKDEADDFSSGPSYSLNDITVSSRNITIRVYDHGQIDGDRITIKVNGSSIFSSHTLRAPPGDSRSVSLRSGSNEVNIRANNEGSVSPNTATIVVSHVVSGPPQQQWSLNMGEDTEFNIRVQNTSSISQGSFPIDPPVGASIKLSDHSTFRFSKASSSLDNQSISMSMSHLGASGRINYGTHYNSYHAAGIWNPFVEYSIPEYSSDYLKLSFSNYVSGQFNSQGKGQNNSLDIFRSNMSLAGKPLSFGKRLIFSPKVNIGYLSEFQYYGWQVDFEPMAQLHYNLSSLSRVYLETVSYFGKNNQQNTNSISDSYSFLGYQISNQGWGLISEISYNNLCRDPMVLTQQLAIPFNYLYSTNYQLLYLYDLQNAQNTVFHRLSWSIIEDYKFNITLKHKPLDVYFNFNLIGL